MFRTRLTGRFSVDHDPIERTVEALVGRNLLVVSRGSRLAMCGPALGSIESVCNYEVTLRSTTMTLTTRQTARTRVRRLGVVLTKARTTVRGGSGRRVMG